MSQLNYDDTPPFDDIEENPRYSRDKVFPRTFKVEDKSLHYCSIECVQSRHGIGATYNAVSSPYQGEPTTCDGCQKPIAKTD